jgi:fumarate hydratase class II
MVDAVCLLPVLNIRHLPTDLSDFRTEHDSMGDVRVPARAYYGAQTQRAVENFPVSGWVLMPELVHALGLVKYAAAVANRDLGKLTGTGKNPLKDDQVNALLQAAREVAEGKFDDQFPIDVFQTGSGTSSNMNANEVISNRAIEIGGGDRFSDKKPIHPNDHINMGQSTNDMFPTAIHVAAALAIEKQLIPALKRFQTTLAEKARAWDEIIKIGRTHLADATPLRLKSLAGLRDNWSCPSIGLQKLCARSSSCLPAAPPWGRELTRIRSLAAAWPRRSRTKPA